ncbi:MULTISPECIES: glycosyltransferase family 39 protein [Inquilinus]|uniref:4-amino-4-deoxy-L-arabinose transferase-like glycosyltransferase n=1 Tax=Inquilinus ginsengisoli TaxID=363840 RepID=A0ABU1JM14_9PROT|nr:glycosyltransferase family 39 protein [Inquilinus ginsengisoli]MDR6289651.1 4-amino-4-deoxy-L-arabinose transferase-like glycosyltransferase [Inquilinus ginsengisoli]
MMLDLPLPMARPIGEARRILLLLAAHVAAWTGFCLLYLAPSDLQNDMTEAFSWAQELQLGYYKHPPFYAWVVKAWFSVLPTTDWAFYLLASTNAAIGLAAVWAIAGRYLSGPARLAAVLLLEFLPFYTFQSFNFNANAVLLSLWPLTVLAFLRSFERRDVRSAVALGAVAAAAMLSKYYSGIILACCLAAALAHPDRRRYFAGFAPYLALAVLAAGLAPHVLWHLGVAIGPVDYMASKGSTRAALILAKAGLFVVGCIALHALFGAVLAWLWSRGGAASAEERPAAPSVGDRRMLAVFALGPFLVTVLIALVFQVRINTHFAIPIFALSPLAAIVWLRLAVDAATLRRLAVLAALWLLLLLGVAPVAGAWTLRHDVELAAEPRRAVAEQVTALWRDRIGRPLGVVAGTESYALGTTFYSPDHPSDFTAFAAAYAPWIDADRLRRDGLAVICLTGDGWCLDEAAKYDGLEIWRTQIRVHKTLFGLVGRDFDFTLVFVRPGQTLPLVPVKLRPF